MIPDNWLDILKAEMPKRQGHHGWQKVRTLVPKLIADGHDWETILQGVRNYRVMVSRAGNIGTSYCMMAQTLLGPGQYVIEYAGMDLRTPQQKAEEAKWQALEARAAAMGFTTLDRSKGLYVAERAIEAEEAKRRTNVVQIPRARVVT